MHGMNSFLNEVVGYGPFALRRADVYRLMIIEGHKRKAADSVAYGYTKPVDGDPMTLLEVADFLDEVHGSGRAADLKAALSRVRS